MTETKLAWVMFYTSVMGWQYHPGNKERLTTGEAAKVADEMLQQMEQRYKQWVGWQPHK